MFQKSCEGCGSRFEAQKASRRWCSDVCGRRTRRQNARAFSPVIAPSLAGRIPDMSDISPDSVTAETLRDNITFARFVNPDLTVDLDFIAGLADPVDPGWASGCSESDWALVGRVLVSRLIGKLQELESELEALASDEGADSPDTTEVEADMTRLSEFLGDEFSDRVVGCLASALRA